MNIKGRYTGSVAELQGKTALLGERPNARVVAQFDDLKLEPWCYGWHEFPRADFQPVKGYKWFGDKP